MSLSLLAGAVTKAGMPSRNLFREYLAKSEIEIDAKIAAAWSQFVAGDENSQRLFYAVGDDAAYILDTDNQDIRSEGMSYGMMIVVQLDRRDVFDRLWTWAALARLGTVTENVMPHQPP